MMDFRPQQPMLVGRGLMLLCLLESVISLSGLIPPHDSQLMKSESSTHSDHRGVDIFLDGFVIFSHD